MIQKSNKRISSKISFFVLFAGLLLVHAAPANTQEKFSRSTTFCAVDMNFSELLSLINLVQESLKNYNRNISRGYSQEILLLQDKFSKLELKDNLSIEAISRGPERITRMWYRSNISDDAPISNFDFSLGDYERKLSISGANRNSVDAFILLIEEQMGKIGCSFGGSKTRSIYGIIFWLIGLGLGLFPLSFLIIGKLIDSQRELPMSTMLTIAIVSLVLMFSVFVLPWSDWYPGTIIRKHPISTWDQLEPYIVIMSIVIAIASLMTSIVHLRGRRKNM